MNLTITFRLKHENISKLRLELSHTNSLLYIIILMKDDKMNAERGNKNINNPLQKKKRIKFFTK